VVAVVGSTLDKLQEQLLKTGEQLSLLEGDLAAKVESLLVREVTIKATEKEVAAICAKISVERSQVTADTQKWCEKLMT
jgi:hypothetical protein